MMKITNVKLIIIVLVLAIIAVAGFYWYMAVYKKPANLVVISNCSQIKPARLDVAEGEDILFNNKDKIDHSFTIGGKAINVPAGETVIVKADFPYGAATYSYDCDGLLNAAEIGITNNSAAAVAAEPVKPVFNEWYDNLSLSFRNCIKKALGGEFNKAYTDPSYEISFAATERMRSCSEEPSKEDMTFKGYYDSQGKALQECLKNGLGDEFDKLYKDTNTHLNEEHSTNMVACLNGY